MINSSNGFLVLALLNLILGKIYGHFDTGIIVAHICLGLSILSRIERKLDDTNKN
jgi:hypothetical protein